jgi:hypothetical protein
VSNPDEIAELDSQRRPWQLWETPAACLIDRHLPDSDKHLSRVTGMRPFDDRYIDRRHHRDLEHPCLPSPAVVCYQGRCNMRGNLDLMDSYY